MGDFSERFMARQRNARSAAASRKTNGTAPYDGATAEDTARVKGALRGACNVTACQAPGSAIYFNRSTKAYYCEHCAGRINRANPDAVGGALCVIDPEARAEREARRISPHLPPAMAAGRANRL